MSAAPLYTPASSQSLRASHDEAPTTADGRVQPFRMRPAGRVEIHESLFQTWHIGSDSKRQRAVLSRTGLVVVEIIGWLNDRMRPWPLATSPEIRKMNVGNATLFCSGLAVRSLVLGAYYGPMVLVPIIYHC